MRERANLYCTEADTVNGAMNKMNPLFQQLQSECKGTASEFYATCYQKLKPGFMKADELIHKIAAALDSATKLVKKTDANIANHFRV